ncbi:MAG: acetyl-CoA carboxylase biotin carboxyl carrier protein [Bacteroidota bacterium]
MDFKQIQELIKLINKLNLTEFKLEDGDFKLSIRTEKFAETKIAAKQSVQQILPIQSIQPQVQPIVQVPQTQAPATPSAEKEGPAPDKGGKAEEEDNSDLVYVKSPIVGTFYRSSSPDKPPFIKVGDTIASGDVVCIVEAMKLFNEIESEVSGKIVKVLVDDSSPVEYEQALFLVDPKG